MKSIILTEFGGSENFALATRPRVEAGKGELSVAVKAVSFKPVDVAQRLGKHDGSLPAIPGGDMSGIIETVGEGVARFAKGEEVYARVGSGTYTESVTSPAQFFARKPSNLDFSQAAAIPVAGLTSYVCVLGKFRISRGPF